MNGRKFIHQIIDAFANEILGELVLEEDVTGEDKMKKFLNCLFVVAVIVGLCLTISCEEEVVQNPSQENQNQGFVAPLDGIWELKVINTKWKVMDNAVTPLSSTVLDLMIVQSGEKLQANFVTADGTLVHSFPLTITGSNGVITVDRNTKYNLHFSANPDGSQSVCTIIFVEGNPIYFEYVEK